MPQQTGWENILRNLFSTQKLAVLATQGSTQPHTSLMAFAETENLKYLLFVTSRNTLKYQNITKSPRVAILIDNRTNRGADFSSSLAVTAIGRTEEAAGNELAYLRGIYLAKHRNMEEFAVDADNVLLKVEIEQYMISNFKDVVTLKPSD
jgi:uncharacterized pyridoxamine 5'-phosphate oxidase family protein